MPNSPPPAYFCHTLASNCRDRRGCLATLLNELHHVNAQVIISSEIEHFGKSGDQNTLPRHTATAVPAKPSNAGAVRPVHPCRTPEYPYLKFSGETMVLSRVDLGP
ncbi:MAG: hypothetical protein R3B67_00275 [Phycisphaerales bacterium]